MNKILKAFSLIELMVVIAIISVLAAIALPAYNVYVTKSKIASLIPVMESLKVASVQYFDKHRTWPTSNIDIGVATTDSLDSDLITSFSVCPTGCFGAVGVNDYDGDFGYYIRIDPTKLSLPAAATNPTLIFNAIEDAGVFTWYCTTDSITYSAANNISAIYLPSGCVSPD